MFSTFLKDSSRGIHEWLSRFLGKQADSNPEKSSFNPSSWPTASPAKSDDSSQQGFASFPGVSAFQNIFGGGLGNLFNAIKELKHNQRDAAAPANSRK